MYEKLLNEIAWKGENMKNNQKRYVAIALICSMVITGLAGCSSAGKIAEMAKNQIVNGTLEETEQPVEEPGVEPTPQAEEPEKELTEEEPAEVIDEMPEYIPSVPSYTVEEDFSNVENMDRFYFQDHMKEKLGENLFLVENGSWSEFFDLYESNRYLQCPSFITTDSMMHTYHLYFSMLQKNTELEYLAALVDTLSIQMAEEALAQHEQLIGTEWEDAAAMNVVFFTVGASLMGEEVTGVPTELQEKAQEEIQLIYDAQGVEISPLMGGMEDYSQYKPRGYYEGNELLEKYFRTMMWYGRCNFAQNSETANRAALLMTMALEDEAKENWEAVYAITSFFAGASDDAGYEEYAPLIREAYGENVDLIDLIGNATPFEKYQQLTAELDPPAINSVVFPDDEGKTDKTEEAKGYRFMGQRYSLDAAVFTQLCYSKVEAAPDGSQRMLPDALDVPAAMGSDTALQILEDNGHFYFEGYEQNMNAVRERIQKAPAAFWSASLYSDWLYTLQPLLEEKGEGYPSFMQNTEWNKKNLEGFLGSWTELKHDTVLYSKQFMAEMGGGDEEIDDRGYVEPQPELYYRLSALAKKTSQGLEQYGIISDDDIENLAKLSELADRLMDISIKELTGQEVTEDDYELIRTYGGNIEHFWEAAIRSQADDAESISSQEFPAALVVDVATDPNGSVLEEAIGGVSDIYVIVPIDGKLRIAKGGVFTYYQFEQPISERLTDSEWRKKIGMELTDDMEYQPDDSIEQPEWTQSYRSEWIYE